MKKGAAAADAWCICNGTELMVHTEEQQGAIASLALSAFDTPVQQEQLCLVMHDVVHFEVVRAHIQMYM